MKRITKEQAAAYPPGVVQHHASGLYVPQDARKRPVRTKREAEPTVTASRPQEATSGEEE